MRMNNAWWLHLYTFKIKIPEPSVRKSLIIRGTKSALNVETRANECCSGNVPEVAKIRWSNQRTADRLSNFLPAKSTKKLPNAHSFTCKISKVFTFHQFNFRSHSREPSELFIISGCSIQPRSIDGDQEPYRHFITSELLFTDVLVKLKRPRKTEV